MPIFAIAFGTGADASYVQRLATETNGQFYPANAADVAGVYGTIADQLRSQYVLTLEADAAA